MRKEYSMEQFNDDLKQLGGMIENFYSQNGGKTKKRSGGKIHSFKQSGGEENNVNEKRNLNKTSLSKDQPISNASNFEEGYSMEGKDGKIWTVKKVKGVKKWVFIRYFKVLSVNGKPYPKYARYKGAEPKDAAKKAGKWICKALDMNNKNCKLEFQLKETTRGSDHRSYGPYKGHWEKLSKPKTFKFKGMAKPETMTHKFVVKLHKK
jgi:hypothetical protein